MSKLIRILGAAAVLALCLTVFPQVAPAQELVVKSCPELMRMSESYRDDLKTADVILGSAIDMGDIERIKSYKLKKSAAKNQLESVLKALELKGCVKSK